MSKSTLTRRALVASTAAMPAAAALGLPSHADPTGSDAELLKLGAAFGRIEQDWIAQQEIDAKHRAEWEDACIRAGLPRIPRGTIPDDEWHAYLDKRSAIRTESGEMEKLEELEEEREELGLPSVWDKIHDPLYRLVDEILSLKASTPAGFAVQAKATAYAAADLWSGYSDNAHERLFIEAACAFCNITPGPIARWRLRIAAGQIEEDS